MYDGVVVLNLISVDGQFFDFASSRSYSSILINITGLAVSCISPAK